MLTRSVVIGVFNSKPSAKAAVDDLRQAGFADDVMGVVARDSEVRTELQPGRATATLGRLWGLGVAAGPLPAVGPVIAAGTLIAILASSGPGMAAGGLAAALVGWGIPEEESRSYQSELEAGRILVAVRADGRMREAFDVLVNRGGLIPQQASATHAAAAR